VPGLEQCFNTKLDIQVNCYWNSRPDELPHPLDVSRWFDELYAAFPCHLDIFQAITTVNIWHPDRPDCPEVKHHAGLTYWDGRIDIASWAANRGTIAHEFGHWVALFHKVDPETTAPNAKLIWKVYEAMRGHEFTPGDTPGPERWAEDYKALYGGPAVAGKVEPNDDSNDPGSTIRKPWDVPGLAQFLDQFPTVIRRWNQFSGISDVYYANGLWQWSRPGWWFMKTWERYEDGQFYTWVWNKWVPGLT
jgi:hypothetical protein